MAVSADVKNALAALFKPKPVDPIKASGEKDVRCHCGEPVAKGQNYVCAKHQHRG